VLTEYLQHYNSRGPSGSCGPPVGLEYTIMVMTCEYSWVSDGDLVLVGEAAEGLFSADPVIFEVDLRWLGAGLSG
jgi:hypothetical protein